jgi:outer membrane protein assembly factor BamB
MVIQWYQDNGFKCKQYLRYELDPNHEIYFSIKDTLFKFSAAIGHPLLWKTVTPTSSYIKDHVRLLVGSSDSMYACSIYTNSAQTSLNGKVLCFNKVNGALLWETIATSTSNSDQQVNNVSVLEDDSTIVTSWKHAYVGSGSNQLITCKIRKKEGGLVWKSKITYTKHSAAIAIAEDNQNNLYLTGYFNSDNYGPWKLEFD